MNWKGFARNWTRPFLYYLRTRLEELGKTTKSQDSRPTGRGLNPGHPEQGSGVLSTGSQRSVTVLSLTFPHVRPVPVMERTRAEPRWSDHHTWCEGNWGPTGPPVSTVPAMHLVVGQYDAGALPSAKKTQRVSITNTRWSILFNLLKPNGNHMYQPL
jgi:hypothetical protein